MIIIHSNLKLKANTSTCTLQCQENIDYVARYTKPSDMTLAVISVKEYKNADDFFARAFGKRTRYDYRKIEEDGYTFHKLTLQERNNRLDELYSINTSTDERQGDKMNDTYYDFPIDREENTCSHHFINTYGAFNLEGIWIGYIDMIFAGEWSMAKYLLGHKKHLDACKRGSFMVNLWYFMVKDVIENYPEVNYVQYHLMGVGNPGLDEWKKRVGLVEMKIKDKYD